MPKSAERAAGGGGNATYAALLPVSKWRPLQFQLSTEQQGSQQPHAYGVESTFYIHKTHINNVDSDDLGRRSSSVGKYAQLGARVIYSKRKRFSERLGENGIGGEIYVRIAQEGGGVDRSRASTPTGTRTTAPKPPRTRAAYTTSHCNSSPAGYVGYYEDYDEELGSELTDEEDVYLDEDDDEYDLDGDGEDGVVVALEISVKEMALGDWARAGYWIGRGWRRRMCISGCRNLCLPRRRAPLPLPLLLLHRRLGTGPSNPRSPPRPADPSTALAEAAHNAHVKNMRTVLPVFKNVVRRLIVESTTLRTRAPLSKPGSARVGNRSTPPCARDVVQQLR
ncbi:hypothetical protein DFH07DRAFT_770417 [Mycena maculata]|uniref:Uncharacterized protein n=1 Tax=Mycena maculata TaxID=230809 RepID=A0AAD7JHI1_9AGAR|nr:hypothetical protein DFH07DRAFT_770417 [Mycena maculata]